MSLETRTGLKELCLVREGMVYMKFQKPAVLHRLCYRSVA